jgi:phosphopantetheinyl transferase
MPGEFDVDVVRACLADVSDLSRYTAVLAEDERSRAPAYRLPEPRDVFTLTRGLLRLELGSRLGLDPREVRFDVRPSGKPDLRRATPPGPDWRFSVSHTGPHLAIAFALGTDVGIDIEPLDRAAKPLTIAKRYFTPREYEALSASSEEARTPAFFAGWTRKEAIVKARGGTMAESLTTLSVELDPLAIHPGYEDALSRPPCRLTSFTVADRDLIGAVALCSDLTPRLRFRILSSARFD